MKTMGWKTEYCYAVVECDADGKVNNDASHWVYKFIHEAIKMRNEMNRVNPDLKFIILHLNKR